MSSIFTEEQIKEMLQFIIDDDLKRPAEESSFKMRREENRTPTVEELMEKVRERELLNNALRSDRYDQAQ
jgi:hypothetical protein